MLRHGHQARHRFAARRVQRGSISVPLPASSLCALLRRPLRRRRHDRPFSLRSTTCTGHDDNTDCRTSHLVVNLCSAFIRGTCSVGTTLRRLASTGPTSIVVSTGISRRRSLCGHAICPDGFGRRTVCLAIFGRYTASCSACYHPFCAPASSDGDSGARRDLQTEPKVCNGGGFFGNLPGPNLGTCSSSRPQLESRDAA